MVKRSTDFKQMYLVDATFLKYHEQLNQNVKNSISNNHQISVSIPETRNTSDKSYTALSKQNDLNSLTFNNYIVNKLGSLLCTNNSIISPFVWI